ncbi:MAG: histidine triad nucleotide-binding protein [Firmicutes bacterium]|nr:histidine triad nucleotide-binding protein [Bacillota bacterium]
MSECIFCRIAAGELSADIVHEDDQVLVFKDITPQAPIHLLLIPKRHVSTLLELTEEDGELLTHVFTVIRKVAVEYGLSKKGFRTVINTGDEGGQTVGHLHFHLLGGRHMQWPPG